MATIILYWELRKFSSRLNNSLRLTRQDVKNLLLLTREVLRAFLSVVDLAIASIDLYETITGFGNRAIRDGKGTDASIFVFNAKTLGISI